MKMDLKILLGEMKRCILGLKDFGSLTIKTVMRKDVKII